MKFFPTVAAAVLAGVCLLPAQKSKPAPTQEPIPLNDQERILVDVTRVNVLYTVSDKRGRFVTDLGKEAFEVFDGKNRQNIIEFAAESDLPLRLAVLIDTSNSVRDRFRFQQEAALEFLRSVMRAGKDKAIVVGFDSEPALTTDLTDDMAKLEAGIRAMRPCGLLIAGRLEKSAPHEGDNAWPRRPTQLRWSCSRTRCFPSPTRWR